MAGTNPADTNIDGLLSSSSDTAPIVSAPAEIAAVADGNSAIIDRDALLANATDADGDSLNVVVDTSTLPDGVTYNHVDGSTVDVTTTSYYGFTQTITIPAVDTLALDTSSAQFTSLAAGETMDVVVSYDVTDGTLATQAEAVFHVTGVNDAPVVSSAVAVEAIEGGEVATLDALASASDPDHGAVLTVVAPPPPPGETENFVNAAGVVEGAAPPPPPPMPFDASTLPAGISFDAVSNSFSIDPSNPAFGTLSAGEVVTVTVNYGVSDGIAVTAANATFTITGTNDAPVVTGPGTFSVQEDFGVASVAPTSGELEVEAPEVEAPEVEAPEVEVPEVELHDLAEKDGNGSIVIPNSINLLVNASDPDHGANLSVVDLPAELPQGISYLHVDPVVTTAGYYGATTTTPGVDALVIDPTNAAFQSLAEGETITITVDYAVSDGFVSTPAQAIFTITGTNDAPVIDGQVMAIGNEDGTLVAANALANASDVDHGAVLSITATPAVAAPDDYWARGAGEVDDHGVDSVDGTPIHVSFDISALPSFITFDETTNTLTLDPSDASFQHLSSGETMTVSVNYGVTDGIAPAASFASTTFTVVGTNDAPIVSGPATLTVNEDQGASATGVATDDSGFSEAEAVELEAHGVDTALLPNAINLLANASDVDHHDKLSVVDMPAELPVGVSYVHIPASSTPTGYYGAMVEHPAVEALVIDPSDAAFQSLADGEVLQIVVDYGISDGTVTTPTQAVFTVVGTNDAPVVSGAVTASLNEGDPVVTVDALAYASDVDHGAVLTVTEAPPAAADSGTVEVSGPYYGALRVQHGNSNANSSDDLTQDPAHTGTTGPMVYDLLGLPAGVNFDAATNTFSIDPSNAAYEHLAAGESQTVTVAYGITDGIAVTSATTSFTVVGTNDAPVVSGPAHLTVVEDGQKLVFDNTMMLSNAGDVDTTDVLQVVDIQSVLPQDVSLIDSAGSYIAVPDPSAYYGIRYDYVPGGHGVVLDTSAAEFQSLAQGETMDIGFTYGVSDGTVTTATQGIFTVVGANDAPIVTAPITATASEDSAIVTVNALANAYDVDHATVLSITAAPATNVVAGGSEVSGPYYGGLRIRNSNSNSASSDSDPTAPTADTGPVYDISSLPAGVTFDPVTNSFSLDPTDPAYQSLSEGQAQTVTVNYGVTDGIAVTAAKVTFTVIGANDGPVVTGSQSFSATEDSLIQVVTPLANVADVDQLDHLSIVPAALPDGLQTISVPGGYYMPDIVKTVFNPGAADFQSLAQGEVRTFSWDYQVTDGHTTTSNSATFTVTGVNDAPVIVVPVGATSYEDAAAVTVDALAQATDIDHGAVLSVVNVPAVLPAGISYDAATHSFSINPADPAFQSLAQGEMQTFSVSYGISDGMATTMTSVEFTVIGVNDAPVVTGPILSSPNEDGNIVSVNALGNTTDADDPQFQGHGLFVKDVPASLPAGVSYDAATQRFSLDPSNAAYQSLSSGESTDVTVSYTVSDGYVEVPTSVIFTVSGKNDAPVVSGTVQAGSISENAPALDIGLLANAADIDHLDVVHVKTGQGAAVTADVTSGTWTAPVAFNVVNDHLVIDPAQFNSLRAGEAVDITFTYQVTDGNKQNVDPTATAHVTIVGQNDAPLSIGLSTTHAIDQSTAGTVVAKLSAVDPDHAETFTYQLLNDQHGLFALSGNNLVVANGAMLDANVFASDTIGVQVTDAAGASIIQNFTISIDPIPGVTINGSGKDDVYSLTSATMQTTNGVDAVHGNNGNDYIDGAGGSDMLFGDSGNDTLLGGAGNDTLTGGGGKDAVDGGDGNDRIQINNTDDTFDVLTGGVGTDTIAVLNGNAVNLNGFNAATQSFEVWEGNGKGVTGTSAAETFDFSGLTVVTGSGMGFVDAGDGSDKIIGTKFADDLRGGAGNDVISGGQGNDLLSGGAGSDSFVFNAGFGKDKITDFTAGTGSTHDVIDFDHSVFANYSQIQAAMTQVGSDVVIAAGADTVTIAGVNAASLVSADFLLH